MIARNSLPVGVLRQRPISSMGEGTVYASCYNRFQIEGSNQIFDVTIEQVERFGLRELVGKRVAIEHQWDNRDGIIITKVVDMAENPSESLEGTG
jgi:hypothetical protein